MTKDDLVTPPAVAWISTVVKMVTGLVVPVKLCMLFPSGTITVAGT